MYATVRNHSQTFIRACLAREAFISPSLMLASPPALPEMGLLASPVRFWTSPATDEKWLQLEGNAAVDQIVLKFAQRIQRPKHNWQLFYAASYVDTYCSRAGIVYICDVHLQPHARYSLPILWRVRWISWCCQSGDKLCPRKLSWLQ